MDAGLEIPSKKMGVLLDAVDWPIAKSTKVVIVIAVDFGFDSAQRDRAPRDRGRGQRECVGASREMECLWIVAFFGLENRVLTSHMTGNGFVDV